MPNAVEAAAKPAVAPQAAAGLLAVHSSSATERRVHGYDLLRGICAIFVALFHLLHWLGFGEFYSWGLFGVYIFFVLSGASMVVAYRERFARGLNPMHFLGLRFARLAPLFCLVIAVTPFFMPIGAGFIANALLNVSFLFGIGGTVDNSVVTGGWSLGIEFAFYLMFPILLSLIVSRYAWMIGALLIAAQLVFVHLVLHRQPDFGIASATYTQPLAFIAYFYVGGLIGFRLLEHRRQTAWAVWLFVGCLLAIGLGSGASETDTLTGLRGVLLFTFSILAVYFAGHLVLPGSFRRIAAFVGDTSYGVYLLHPLVYLALKHVPLAPAALIATCVVVSSLLAYASYCFYERPLRNLAKRRFGSPSHAPPF